MERADETQTILRQFKKKSKRIINKNFFTEFFYLNKQRQIVEFLRDDSDVLFIESFFKQFLPSDFRNFVSMRVINDEEEDVDIWYYDKENLSIILEVNWGFKKQEIALEIDAENFKISIIDDTENFFKVMDYQLLNDYLISFLSIQAKTLSETFEALAKNKKFDEI